MAAMDEDKKVWVPHPVDGYTMGRIIDIGGDTVTVEPFNAPGQVSTGLLFVCLVVTTSNYIELYHQSFTEYLSG